MSEHSTTNCFVFKIQKLKLDHKSCLWLILCLQNRDESCEFQWWHLPFMDMLLVRVCVHTGVSFPVWLTPSPTLCSHASQTWNCLLPFHGDDSSETTLLLPVLLSTSFCVIFGFCLRADMVLSCWHLLQSRLERLGLYERFNTEQNTGSRFFSFLGFFFFSKKDIEITFRDLCFKAARDMVVGVTKHFQFKIWSILHEIWNCISNLFHHVSQRSLFYFWDHGPTECQKQLSQ